jgi:4-aminobutyrate aminotransferase/(S)-3-amino-2-methylpropionate transaminase
MHKTIQLTTKVPGPKSRALAAEREANIPRGVYQVTPVVIAQAKGATITDIDGNTFIDFAGGIGVMNVGHSNAKIVQALKEQLERFTHACFHVNMYEPYIQLAQRLNERVPGDFAKKTLFLNSGAEGVENAVKIARAYTGRSAVICFEHAFHGRTLLGMSLTSKIDPYKRGFGPFAPEIYRVPFPYCYRCPLGLEYPDCAVDCFCLLERAFVNRVADDSAAAIIIEPVVGEGGFIVTPPEYMRKLRQLCDERGILLIVDEVQTGLGRTGKLFAIEHYDVIPDMLVTAKSLAGGLPLSSVTGRAQMMDAPQVGGLGGTYSGNPLACVAALAVLDVIEEQDLPGRAQQIGTQVKARLQTMKERYPLIGDVRGLGAMMALELVADQATKTPAKEATGKVAQGCYHHGLILITAGTYGNVIRTLMPLSITDGQLVEGLDILEEALADVSEEMA